MGTITVSRTSYRDGKRSSEVQASITSLRPGEHAEYWKQTQKQLAMTSQRRKGPEGEQLQSLAITGPADAGDFLMPCGAITTRARTTMAMPAFAKKGGADKKGNNLRDNAKHVRIRQPADGDASAAGRTEQEGEKPEDQQGRALLRAQGFQG